MPTISTRVNGTLVTLSTVTRPEFGTEYEIHCDDEFVDHTPNVNMAWIIFGEAIETAH